MRINLRKAAALVSRNEISHYLKSIEAPTHDFANDDFGFLESNSPKEEQALFAMGNNGKYS